MNRCKASRFLNYHTTNPKVFAHNGDYKISPHFFYKNTTFHNKKLPLVTVWMSDIYIPVIPDYNKFISQVTKVTSLMVTHTLCGVI